MSNGDAGVLGMFLFLCGFITITGMAVYFSSWVAVGVAYLAITAILFMWVGIILIMGE